jgi:hypothetical protein
MLIFRFGVHLFLELVEAFPKQEEPPDRRVMQRLLLGQAILLLAGGWCWISLGLLSRPTDGGVDFRVFQWGRGVVCVVDGIGRHLISFADGRECGNSRRAHRQTALFALVVKVLGFLNYVRYLVARLWLLGSSVLVNCWWEWRTVQRFWEAIQIYRNFRKMIKKIRENGAEANEDGICVFCRDELTQGDITKLRCGHSLHVDCLESWISGGELVCPMCRTDIAYLLAEAPPNRCYRVQDPQRRNQPQPQVQPKPPMTPRDKIEIVADCMKRILQEYDAIDLAARPMK